MYEPTRVLVTPFTDIFCLPHKRPPVDTLSNKKRLISKVKYTSEKWILVFFKTMFFLTLLNFLSFTTVMCLCPVQKVNIGNLNSTNKHSCSLSYISMFPISFFYHLMNLSFHHQSLNYFSQSIRAMSNNFHTLTGFLRVNWNCMFTLLVLWFSEALKFFNYDILIITIMITLIYDLNFATQRSDISFLT